MANFDSFGNLIYAVGQALTAGFIKKALAGAGLGLGTYAGISTLLEKIINDSKSLLYAGDSTVLQILGLGGVDTALSIILSACVVRMTISTSSVFLVANK